jgi:hypothetical protein
MDVSSATMTPRADERELSIFDSKNELILDVWMKGGQIERMELFRHMVDKTVPSDKRGNRTSGLE